MSEGPYVLVLVCMLIVVLVAIAAGRRDVRDDLREISSRLDRIEAHLGLAREARP